MSGWIGDPTVAPLILGERRAARANKEHLNPSTSQDQVGPPFRTGTTPIRRCGGRGGNFTGTRAEGQGRSRRHSGWGACGWPSSLALVRCCHWPAGAREEGSVNGGGGAWATDGCRGGSEVGGVQSIILLCPAPASPLRGPLWMMWGWPLRESLRGAWCVESDFKLCGLCSLGCSCCFSIPNHNPWP